MSKGVVLDIETDALDAKVIHCIVSRDIKTNEINEFVQEECYTKFPEWSKTVDTFYMHNGLAFDQPIINKLTQSNIEWSKVIDTLILTQLLNPNIDKGNSLGAWGDRLGFPKEIPPKDFSIYTPYMLEYCNRDVDVTHKLVNYLSKKSSLLSNQSIKLEHKIRALVTQQEKNGFALDEQKAMVLMNSLHDEASRIEQELQEVFKPIVTKRYHKTTNKPLADHVETFNPASGPQIAKRLTTLGWKPKDYTEKGNIIVGEEILSKIDLPEAKLIARYRLLEKRVSQIKQWIKAVDIQGRVHGRVQTLSAVTGRMTHNSPNMAQVPAVYSPYGKGKIVGTNSSGGQRLIDTFLKNAPALQRLRNQVDKAAKQKVIKGLDGRQLQIKYHHAALNTLIQGAGAIICKQWLIRMMELSKSLDVRLVASIHDEYQFEVHDKDVKEFCSITKKAMKETEEILNVKFPLDNEYKVGKTWADTH